MAGGRRWGAMLLLGLLLRPGEAAAFRLSLHRALTDKAVELEAADAPSLRMHKARLVRANLSEDLNLPVKWGRYSHYYRPNHALHIGRRTSEERVERLWAALAADAAAGRKDAAYARLGKLLHHVQDMASPPHVIPVPHDLSDGFEGYGGDEMIASLPDYPLAAPGGGDQLLAALAGGAPAPLAARDAHLALAADTWRVVTEGGATICGRDVRWTEVWALAEGESFGGYGALPFGDASGWPAECELEVKSAYDAFIQERLAAALAATRLVLREGEALIERGALAADARDRGAAGGSAHAADDSPRD